MSGLIPLNEEKIITKIRFLSDQRNSDFVSDEEIRTFIQSGFNDIYYEIVDKDEDWFIKKVIISPERTNKFYYPDDFYKIRLIQLNYDENKKLTAQPIQLSELENYQKFVNNYFFYDSLISSSGESFLKYYHFKDYVLLFPESFVSNRSITLYYAPIAPDVGNGALLPKGYDEYIIYYVACQIGIGENVNLNELKEEKTLWKNKILNWADTRDTSFPKTVSNIRYNRFY